MRLATYVVDGHPAVGLVEDGHLIEVARHLPAAPASVRGVLEAGSLDALAGLLGKGLATLSLDAVEFLPVVPDPRKIFAILLNYEEDRIGQGRPKLQFPHLMARFADCQIGHDQQLTIPRVTAEFDFEGELAVVIGRGGRHIIAADAYQHVAGYACYNDCGARDYMRHTRHFTSGKNFPDSAGFGPWLTTADEAPSPDDMTLTTRLNGEVYQSAKIELSFSIPTLIAYISAFTTLNPGDVIATGSPSGAGHTRSPPRFLRPGDAVEVEIPGVGLLRNTCVAEAI